MKRRFLLPALALVLACAGADARTPAWQFVGQEHQPGGVPPGSLSACDGAGTGVCALFQSGQTFVTWNDLATGLSGNAWRYKVYQSTAAINSGNYASATLIASSITNNSAQLFGGDPAVSGANYFAQSYRQDGTKAMARLSDLGTPLPVWSGLQVHTALANANSYYAVVGVSGGVDTYIGSVGPIAETIATPEAIKIADSFARGTSFGKILAPAGLPIMIRAHASGPSGGCVTQQCIWGDYWMAFMPADASTWQEGRPFPFSVLQDNAQHYPAVAHSLEFAHRDTILDPLGNTPIEAFHWGVGMSPNAAVGAANRLYPNTANAIARALLWTCTHFGADCNAIHWDGASMGAWGAANTAMKMTSPRLASAWARHPIWQMYRRSSAGWPGDGWTSGMTFKATVGVAPSTLGAVASSVLTDTGAVWGGAGGYADTPNWITTHPATDFPFVSWSITKNDGFASFAEQLQASAALQGIHAGHAWVWTMGLHDTGFDTSGALDADFFGAIAGVAYVKTQFRLNLPYIAFANSSIDDNPGTAALTANGLFDGDYTGGKNIGFTWNVTSDTSAAFNFTVGSNWMNRAPTVHPQTTLTGTMAGTGSGSVAVTSSAGFKTASNVQNKYFLVGGDEIVLVTVTPTGNSVSFTTRGLLGSTARAHSAGETIQQISSKATGPNGGPYATMTADVTPRRVQNFTKGTTNGQIPSCVVTPFGAGPSTLTPTVANGIFTLPAITINSGGVTSVGCS